MSFNRPLKLVLGVALAASLSACAGISNPLGGVADKLNPFKKTKNTVVATQGERIPLIALNQKLEVAEGLKGQSIFVPDAVAVDAWPQPGGTPNLWTENAAAGATLQVAFRVGIGKGSDRERQVTATPVIAEGKVFVMDAEARVSARDAATGAKLWDVDTAVRTRRDKEAFGGGVAYADGRLYVASGYRFVAALDAATGAVIWRQTVASPIHGAPAVGGGRVFAVDIDNLLQSFDIATGAPDWNYQALVEPARLLKASAPVISGESVIAAFSSGELVAFRQANGALLWSQTLSRANRSTALSEIRDIAGRPVVSQGDVYAGSHSGVFMAVDGRAGSPKWTLPVTTITTPWPSGEAVYVVSKAGEVIAISRATGQVYWITDLNKGIEKRKHRALYFGPVMANGRLVVVSSKGFALSLDPQTGAETGRVKIGGSALMAPVPANGMLYLTTDDGDLVAIR